MCLLAMAQGPGTILHLLTSTPVARVAFLCGVGKIANDLQDASPRIGGDGRCQPLSAQQCSKINPAGFVLRNWVERFQDFYKN
jgi:hypothetical protein